MNLLTRHLGREIYFHIGLVFSALLMLFAFLDLIHELNVMGQGQYHLGYVLLFVALSIPGHIYELFPVGVLVGTIFALVQMAASSELTIYRASGASLRQIITALFKIALPLVILSFICSEFLAPPSDRMAQQLRLKAQNTQVTLKEFRSGIWAKDEHSFVNAKNVTLDTSLSDVNIYQFDKNQRLQSITNARQANFIGQGQWELKDVVETRFDDRGISTATVPAREWRSALNPDILSVLLVAAEQMSAYDLYRYVGHLKDNRQKSVRYEIAMWNKLVNPLALLVMMLLALPFASYHRRSGGIGAMVFMGIVLGLTFHFVGQLFSSLGVVNEWQPFISATAMTGLFLTLAIIMLWWTEKR